LCLALKKPDLKNEFAFLFEKPRFDWQRHDVFKINEFCVVGVRVVRI